MFICFVGITKVSDEWLCFCALDEKPVARLYSRRQSFKCIDHTILRGGRPPGQRRTKYAFCLFATFGHTLVTVGLEKRL
jgi:hypothetical protein